jgi:hypothetical protein
VVDDAAGQVIEVRDNPRDAFAGHVGETPWDALHAAYFDGYALWTYLTQPFLYTYPGFETAEIEPWEEAGETWRRLRVIFPDHIASHTREQVTYFGPDGATTTPLMSWGEPTPLNTSATITATVACLRRIDGGFIRAEPTIGRSMRRSWSRSTSAASGMSPLKDLDDESRDTR